MRSTVIILLSFLLSLSILGPSFLALIDSHSDIEVALELGEEENKKESKKELDEKKTFFESYSMSIIAKKCNLRLRNNYFLHHYGNHIIDVQSPPPEQFV
jgi:hypothetical protein